MVESCDMYESCCLLTSFWCCSCLVCRIHHLFQTPFVLSKPLLCAHDRAGMSARLKQVVSLSSAVCCQLHSHCSRQVSSFNKQCLTQQQLMTVPCKPCYQRRANSVSRSGFQSTNKLYYMASTTLANRSWRWFVIAAMLVSRHLP